MKKLLGILVLSLSLITPSQADDIRDFQIEGMSVGDSLQNYIDNNKFKHYETADYFKDNKITLYETQLSDFQDFEYVDISFYTKDNKKTLVGDILVTSGNAGVFPQNILVGKVVSVTDGKLIALPFVDTNNLKFVQIINNN